VFLGAFLVREVTANSIRSVATPPKDTNKMVPQDHSGDKYDVVVAKIKKVRIKNMRLVQVEGGFPQLLARPYELATAPESS
jgi:hypothetical protein